MQSWTAFAKIRAMKKHLVFDVSGHGFGHFAQTAAVINHVGSRFPETEITIRTMVEPRIVESRINVPHRVIRHATDFGMAMTSALDVDRDKSFAQYQELHSDLSQRVDEQTSILKELQPDFLFSNISYLSIAAAKQLDIPVAAMCSLNWAHIFRGYFDGAVADGIYQEMIDCYNAADVFLCPEPSMAMPGLHNVQHIAPLASLGTNRRDDLCKSFGSENIRRLILVAPGGIPTRLPIEEWPTYDDIVFLTSWGESTPRQDIIDITEISIPFIDVLKSVDAVFTKPGYGTVAEAICNQVPMLYARRKDWPEEPFLVQWAEQFGKVLEVDRELFYSGEVKSALETLLGKSWEKTAPRPNGHEQAAEAIAELVF